MHSLVCFVIELLTDQVNSSTDYLDNIYDYNNL